MRTKLNERIDGTHPLPMLPRLLLLPCRAQASGVLWLERDDGIRRVVYSAGWPIAAASNAADEQIEAYLLDAGVLDAKRLQQAIALSTKKKIELQQALSELSLLSKTTFVEALLSLRKKIVANALTRACRTRFEESPAAPVGFSYVPLLECCASAVTKWGPAEQQAALQTAGATAITVHAQDADLAMRLGAPKTMLTMLQTLTREPKTAAQLLATPGIVRADVIAAVASGVIAAPQDVAPVSADLDEEIGDALRVAQEGARPSWDPPLPAPVQRPRSVIVPIAIAVVVTALLSVTITRRLSRTPARVVEPIAAAPDPLPASQPSVLTAAAEKSITRAQEPVIRLTDAERLRVDAALKRGHASMKKKKPDLAIKDYQAALELDPLSTDAHRSLAAAHHKRGDMAAAIFEYRIYLRLAPAAADRDAIQEIIDAKR